MKVPSPVMAALARRYRRSQAGSKGVASKDVFVEIEKLLGEVGAEEGDGRELALQQLRAAEQAGVLKLVPADRRDPSSLAKVRISPAAESKFFDWLGHASPEQVRTALAGQFASAARIEIPARWQEPWRNWCEQKRIAALMGKSLEPFDREPSEENSRLLALLPQLLAWKGESLVRFASCVLCGDSKKLELLASLDKAGEHAGKLRGKLGGLLEEITGGKIRALNDLGILPNPRFALIAGPLRLQLDGVWLDLGLLHGSFRISLEDVKRATAIETTARRCLTVENETSFHELAKLRSGELLVQTSYPGAGTVELLKRLPGTLEFWHFGDSDAEGFAILDDLRNRSGRDFQPLHMERGRKDFEQESLGPPTSREWPYYPES